MPERNDHVSELTRDAQADDAKLRILAKLQNLFSNMSVGGFIAMPILILPIFFIDGLAETIFPVVAMFIIFGLIIGGAVGGWLTDRSAKKLAAAYTPSVLARVMDHLDEYDRNATVSRRYLEEDLVEKMRGEVRRLADVLERLEVVTA